MHPEKPGLRPHTDGPGASADGTTPTAPKPPAPSRKGVGGVALHLILLVMASILSAALAPLRLGANVAPMASILLVSAPSLAALRRRLA